MRFNNIAIIFVLLMLFSCKTEKVYFDFGSLENEQYKNDYFKFEIDVPRPWNGQADGAVEWKIKNNYFDPETNEVEDVEADIRDVDDALLLVMVDGEPSLGEVPGSITIFAESLYYNEEVKNGKDYLAYSTEEIVEMGNFTILTEAYDQIILGGKTFYFMDAKLDVDGQEIFQTFISTTTNKFGLSAILTYTNERTKDTMLNIMKTINFYG